MAPTNPSRPSVAFTPFVEPYVSEVLALCTAPSPTSSRHRPLILTLWRQGHNGLVAMPTTNGGFAYQYVPTPIPMALFGGPT
jgi:hypothetical protein